MWRHDWGTCACVLLSKASQGSMHCAQECTHWQTDSVKFNINYTPRAHVGICMQVWIVDVGHMVVVLEHTPSLPCPHAYFFTSSSLHLFFLNVLVCLLFWRPLAILNLFFLTFSQFYVYSIPLQAHHQEPKRKAASLNCGPATCTALNHGVVTATLTTVCEPSSQCSGPLKYSTRN